MVFFNYATMQMAAKIVYYGPGLCGKTTNLHHIYAKTSPQSRGEMVSLETETDRTLFFDLLPIDVGVIGGFKTRLQLYTIPGQVFYNTTRKLVLKGVDGLVFVADSQVAMLDANLESFKNLRENLGEIGLSIDEIPLVLQVNKRDLPNIAAAETVVDVIDPERKYDWVEAVASRGDGVFETLKVISKLTLRTLRRRMTGEEPVRPPSRRSAAEPSNFRVRDEGVIPSQTIAAPAKPSTSKVSTAPIPAFGGATTAAAPPAHVPEPLLTPPPIIEPPIEPVEEISVDDEINVKAPPSIDHIDDIAIPDTAPEPPVQIPEPEPQRRVEPPPMPPEPEIDFGQAEKHAKAAPEVKHVKVRSSVDIMAELESLRKRATQSTPKPASKKETSPLDALRNPPKPKRDIHRTVTLPTPPGTLPKSKRLRITVSFENDGGVVQSQEESLDLGETNDVQSLSVNLKFEDL
ncbi:MAG: mutual gliding-motility protein MglA [Thermoanaerobaculia bacterium]|jgi:signal recognition particle receptor subunit beta|nr:mutual gliding-motility protein MglA [Thermoanaerobaculia bacterium]